VSFLWTTTPLDTAGAVVIVAVAGAVVIVAVAVVIVIVAVTVAVAVADTGADCGSIGAINVGSASWAEADVGRQLILCVIVSGTHTGGGVAGGDTRPSGPVTSASISLISALES